MSIYSWHIGHLLAEHLIVLPWALNQIAQQNGKARMPLAALTAVHRPEKDGEFLMNYLNVIRT